MWKSRIDKLPPAQFFADLLQHLRNLYPGAVIDEHLVKTLRDIWIAEWKNGQNAQDTAKATCSCDGKSIVPSAGAGRELGKRLARPPKGAKRGDFIAPDVLREVTPLASARREAEKYAQAFERVRGAAMKLLQMQGWTPAKGVRLQKLKTLLHEIKGKHDAAVAQYEAVARSRREAKQPDLYAKPLGALGLTLRPGELPEPPPPKEKRPPKEKKPKGKKPPKEKQPAAEKRATEPKTKESPRPAWQPPANLPQFGLAGNLSVMVEAVPNEDFATSTDPDGRHRATVRIPARTFPVTTLGAARELFRAFIEDNGLGGGNMPPTAGRVRLDGKPFAHISYNRRIWRVDGKWKESGQELDESGKPLQEQSPKAGALVKFMSSGPHGPMKLAGTVERVLPDGRVEIRSQNHGIHTLHPSELGHQADDCHCKKTAPKAQKAEVATVSAPIASESADAKPTRTRTKKAPAEKPAEKPAKKKSAEKDAPKPALSDSEAEELANLFAAASAEDKPK